MGQDDERDINEGGNNKDALSTESLPKYREPVIDYCTILQYGASDRYDNLNDLRSVMHRLAYRRRRNERKEDSSSKEEGQLTILISFNQSIFKRKLTHVFMNEFVMSLSMKKETRVTQSKRFPRPCIDDVDALGVTFFIGWR